MGTVWRIGVRNETAFKGCKNLSLETCGKHTLHGLVDESGFICYLGMWP